jgi:hypothetical protein
MARQGPIRNTYEEFPDELKETLKQADKEHGQTPAATTTKEALLHDHVWHLKFLAEGALPPQNLILPLPYPPSSTSTPEARQIRIKDLRIGTRLSHEILLLRTITEPYVYSSTVTIAEDEDGDGEAARLTICNLDDSMHDPVLPNGSILAIKQPCWTKIPGGGYHVRVDHPSDYDLLDWEADGLPVAWRQGRAISPSKDAELWKKEGDRMFLKKLFRRALELQV